MTLADMVNAPTEFELDGETFRVRKPDQLEQGEYQRWLEQLAFDAISRRTYQREDEKLACLRMHDQDCAAGTYEWGGEIAVKRLLTPKGFAKLLSIVCRDQGLTPKKAERLVELESHKLAAVMASKATQDPKVLAVVLASLGLPSDFYSRNSPTRHSEAQKTSPPSSA
jgi:hypothetical protein